jgi:Leucine-rich repeat (LRR) protein
VIGRLTQLERLDLSGNQLSTLPDVIVTCPLGLVIQRESPGC